MTAIAIGMFAGVFSTAFMNGWVVQRMNDALKVEISPIQIHHKAFKDNSELKYFMPDADSLATAIQSSFDVKGAAKRLRSEPFL